MGYRSWDYKELDTIMRLSLSLFNLWMHCVSPFFFLMLFDVFH